MAKWRLVQKTKEMDEIISASLGAHDSISKADTDMIPSHPHPIQNEQSSPEADRGSFVYDESPMRTPHAESDRGYTNASSHLQASYPDQSLHEQYMYNESAVHNTWRHHDPNHDFQGQYYGNGTYNYDHQHHLGSYNRMPATNDGYITARGSTIFSTGISVNIPFGHFGRIEGFSTLAEKLLVPIPLIIDENNSNIIDICLLNHSNKIHQIKKGDCIGQLIIARYVVPRVLKSIK
jgi:dUTPase